MNTFPLKSAWSSRVLFATWLGALLAAGAASAAVPANFIETPMLRDFRSATLSW